MNVSIRNAVLDDFEKLIRLADDLIPLDDWSGRELMLKQSLKDSNCKIHVAEVDDEIVGFIEARVFPDFVEGAPIAIIQNLIVEKEHRTLGIGSELIEKATKDTAKHSAFEIHVWTEFDNQQAIDFYIKHGFEKRALLLEKEV